MAGSLEHDRIPRVAVIGCGMWGANHVRVLDDIGALHVACDLDPARREFVRSRFPHVPISADPAEVFADADVEAVVIAAPATAHGALALDALASGKDVLIEKPMSLDLAEAEAICDLAERTGRVVAVGHVLEHHPAVKRLTELVRSGELGHLRYVYANRLNFGRIRTEENVLWSFAPHDVAIMLRLLGAPPEHVVCDGGSYLNAGVADVTLTQLGFAGGVRGHIYVSWIHPFKEHRFVVVGERRMAVFDDTAPWSEKLVVYEHEVDWVGGQIPVARKAAGQAIPLDEGEPLHEQAEAFLRCVRTRERPLADGRSGLAVLEVLFAAQRSIDSGGNPQSVVAPASGAVHPSAVVDPGAVIGAGTKIWHFVHVMAEAVIGRDCVLGQNTFVGRGVRIGDRVRIQNNVSVFESVEIEQDVFVGPSVVFTNVRLPRAEVDRKVEFERTVVAQGATLGANSTIVCGNSVGRYAFVGAAAVVTKDVPDHALVVGSPARQIGWACRCAQRLGMEDLKCSACGRTFVQADSGLREA